MKLNMKCRWKNKTFWLALIPACLLLVQTVAAVFGYSFDFDALQGRLLDVVNVVFLLLSILGIVVDPTTAGVGDSALAMSYDEPREKNAETDAALLEVYKAA